MKTSTRLRLIRALRWLDSSHHGPGLLVVACIAAAYVAVVLVALVVSP